LFPFVALSSLFAAVLKENWANTKLPASYFGVLLIFGVFFGIMIFCGTNVLGQVVGFVYPTYASYKAIRSSAEGDDKHWLTYWVVYSFFNVIEGLTDILASWYISFVFYPALPQSQNTYTLHVFVCFVRFTFLHGNRCDKKISIISLTS
jgi:hypothetical protein